MQIEDLKSYFDDEDLDKQRPEPVADHSAELFLLSAAPPKTKEDLLALVPARSIVDRLMYRYYGANSPSQHTIHQPTFSKQYAEFWADPSKVSLDWLALLFMIMALGTFFSTFMAPHELEDDSDVPATQRFKEYRAAAGWALCMAKFSSPGRATVQPLLLYIEAEFLINRASQMNCYLLMAVLIRLMLKQGMHRDPSKLPNITPFDGEMRRRVWNLAIQIDLMVSFHLGLPSMIHGIESDTLVPRNLVDTDFDESCTELPPARPESDYTQLTYPIWKSTICRVFGLVARQAHALTLPTYADVMALDDLLESKWRMVPAFMRIRPLSASVTDPPAMINQRFGLSALYQKSRAVLHRRYLIEAVPRAEHAYSRRTCIEAALAMLEYQQIIYDATKPGGMLRQNGWFVTSLAIHDFLLAAMILYLVIQSDAYDDPEGAYILPGHEGKELPRKEELRAILKRSHGIWRVGAKDTPVVKKAASTLEIMLKKLSIETEEEELVQEEQVQLQQQRATSAGFFSVPVVTTDAYQNLTKIPGASKSFSHTAPVGCMVFDEPLPADIPLQQPGDEAQVAFSRNDLMPSLIPDAGLQPPWLASNAMDWESFDKEVSANPGVVDEWMQQEGGPSGWDELNFMVDNSGAEFWNTATE